jgi:hypothetical protein
VARKTAAPAAKTGLRALLATRGFKRGVLGKDTKWLIVFVGVVAGRLLRRGFAKGEELAAIEKLQPGQSILIRAIDRRE